MKTYFKHIITFVVVTIYFPLVLKAQGLNGAFIMSSVGSLQNMSNNSMAVNFSSNANCLNLQNGTAVLLRNNGSGAFSINCEVNIKFNTLGIRLFPNPVYLVSKVKFIKTPPLTDLFSITVWSAEGYKISTIKATGFEIAQGKQMDFSNIHSGSYIIQIESEKYNETLKFIKAK